MSTTKIHTVETSPQRELGLGFEHIEKSTCHTMFFLLVKDVHLLFVGLTLGFHSEDYIKIDLSVPAIICS